MKKGNSPLINGIILGVVFLYLGWYFTSNDMWNPATVVVLILIALLSVGQFIIWFMFFRDPKKKKRKK
ncbi:MAG: hypothetical protein J6X60_07540 [Ruminiclostridium sp.]|nr:hypothetical protein [Ruminiclostridium sp.]